MTEILKNIDYKNVLKNFAELSAVPRGSGNNQGISDFLMDFAKTNGIRCRRDEQLNVMMYKEASEGYEDKPGFIFQGHMDMVCVKEEGCSHDFMKEGLELFIEDGWIGAKGTTLGGDDGISLAYGMSLLTDDMLKHPRLEMIFTTDEETGLFGANALKADDFDGNYLVNLDSENEDTVLCSCSGGMRLEAEAEVERQELAGKKIRLKLHGLKGGHSGAEIHRNRANAVILMARILKMLSDKKLLFLVGLEGGEKDNAIPAAATADLVSPEGKEAVILKELAFIEAELKEEYNAAEPGLKLSADIGGDGLYAVLTEESEMKLLYLLLQAPNGVQAMSEDIQGLVESSLNLGVYTLREDRLSAHYSIRSSKTSYKHFLADKLIFLYQYFDGSCSKGSEYPGWSYKQDSKLRELYAASYEEVKGSRPKLEAIHAGLECGIFSELKPELDMISIGPNMRDIHTPKERLSAESAVNLYKVLEKLLEKVTVES